MTGIVFMVSMMFFMPLVIYFAMKFKVMGKVACAFLEKDGTFLLKLLKPQGPIVEYEGEKYGINARRMRSIRFPVGWPKFFQQSIPIGMWQREDYHPLDISQPVDWMTLKPSKDSAIEVESVLSPRWFRMFAKSTQPKDEGSRTQKLMPVLTLGAAVVAVILVFYVVSQIGGLETDIANVERTIKLTGD